VGPAAWSAAVAAAGILWSVLQAQTLVEFKFNEGGGTSVRSATNNLVGTLGPLITPPAFTTDTPSGEAGDFALEFAPGQYVAIPDPTTVLALDSSNPSFTVEAWVKFNLQPGPRSVLFWNCGPGGALAFSVTKGDH
jgi:hypothetical protein